MPIQEMPPLDEHDDMPAVPTKLIALTLISTIRTVSSTDVVGSSTRTPP